VTLVAGMALLGLACNEPFPQSVEYACPCLNGWECYQDVCRKICSDSDECPGGTECKQGLCKPSSGGGGNPDCTPSCYNTEGGIAECGNDGCGGQCGWCMSGQICVGGHCIEGAAPFVCLRFPSNITGGYDYQLCQGGPVTWSDARAYCQNYGGDLAAAESYSEGEAIRSLFSVVLQLDRVPMTGEMWIGLSDGDSEGDWRWVYGGAFGNQMNWCSGEPNDVYPGEDCAAMGTTRPDCLNDADCEGSSAKAFLCEDAWVGREWSLGGGEDGNPVVVQCLGLDNPSGSDCQGVSFEGCCGSDGRLYWCDGENLFCIDCNNSETACGWSVDRGFYDCNQEGKSEPTGNYPRECSAD